MKKTISMSLLSLAAVVSLGYANESHNVAPSETSTPNHSVTPSTTSSGYDGVVESIVKLHKTYDHAHWGYVGDGAPENWGKIDDKFKMCSKGRMQTPINIVPTIDVPLQPLDLHYTTASTTVINNGHTIQVNIESGSTFLIDKIPYELKQFHFHTPSENNIKSTSFPLEAHFVHATKSGDLAVIGVMFQEGEANPILEKIWSKFPLEVGKNIDFKLTESDIKALHPSNKEYYQFLGSLTTPPCSENVKWHVYKTPLTISKAQTDKFFSLFGHGNNRPIQPTNYRLIKE